MIAPSLLPEENFQAMAQRQGSKKFGGLAELRRQCWECKGPRTAESRAEY